MGLNTKRIFVCLVIMIFFGFQGAAQKINASYFGFNPTDATHAIKRAMNSQYDTIVIDKQSSDWIVTPLRFENIKNKVVVFEEGVIMLAKEKAYLRTNDALLSFKNTNGLTLLGNGATLKMKKSEYIDGEWRHGISLRNCKNVYIENINIKNTGGDGIYLAGTSKGTFCDNITIVNVNCDNNKRQGMSIISAKNVVVKNSTFENTIGTLPGAGVDIEPNTKFDVIENIEFNNCIFQNNDHAGVVLALHKLEKSSKPIDIRFIKCLLQNNHNETNRYIASEIVFGANKVNPVTGSVLFEDCLVQNSKWGLFYSRKTSEAYHVKFKNCSAINICQDNSYPPIYLEVPDYYTGSFSLGGYEFDNLYMQYDSNSPYLQIRGSKLGTLKKVANIKGSITLSTSSEKSIDYIRYDPSSNVAFDLSVIKK